MPAPLLATGRLALSVWHAAARLTRRDPATGMFAHVLAWAGQYHASSKHPRLHTRHTEWQLELEQSSDHARPGATEMPTVLSGPGSASRGV